MKNGATLVVGLIVGAALGVGGTMMAMRGQQGRADTAAPAAQGAPAGSVAAPYSGKSFDSPKYGKITFRPDGIYVSSDQPHDSAKWFRVDDTRAVVWTEGGWGTLFVFENGKQTSAFSIGHIEDKPTWVAPALPD